jgi:hypothetical protein
VAAALVTSPQRRPTAGRLAVELRTLPRRRRRPGGSASGRGTTAKPLSAIAADRLLPGALAGVACGWVASALPFYPAGWPLGLAAAGAALGFAAPRAGLLFTLLAAFFPLANISLGLAALYAALAICWAALNWRDARAGLLLAAGPLVAPIAALPLLPLAAQLARGRVRRSLQVLAGVLLAGIVAGLRRVPLPFDGSTPPLGLGVGGSSRPTAVAATLWHQLVAHPTLVAEALVLAAAAAALPYARARGPWPAALFSGTVLALTATIAPAAAVLPLIAACWLTAAALALQRPT